MKKLIFITLFIFSLQAKAQYFLTGVEPFSIKWRQIRTKNVRIIFPVEAEQKAFRYANLLSLIDTVTPKSLNAIQKPFDIVIHNKSVLSNAFVAWAPKRMEIVSQSPTSTYAQPWLTQLALHETRHISQLYKLDASFVKFGSFFLGEQIVGLSAGIVPNWFLEGDAVAFETAASNSGRGRQADFYQYYRTHYLTQSKRFKYDKWLMGSFKDNIPNHYNLGYQLVSYTKIEYGDSVWANTLSSVSRYPFTVFPFYFGLKKETGLSRKRLFEKAFNNLDSIWSSNQKFNKIDSLTTITKKNKDYTDYRYPHRLNDNLLIVYKTGLSNNPQFTLIDLNSKKEKCLVQPGYLTSIPSYHNENIFWTEYQSHIRWQYLNYSVIKWFNIRNGQIKTISDCGKYYCPVYNPHNDLVYAISANNNGLYSIDAFDTNGKKVKSINLPSEYQPFELMFSQNQKSLIVAVVSDKGKTIINLDDDGSFTILLGSTFLDIHSLSTFRDYILFSTTNNYKEDVFAFNVKTKKVFQITKSPFGSTDPSFDSKSTEILFSNYTTNGYSISKITPDTTNTEIVLPDITDDLISKKLCQALKFNIDSTVIPNNTYEVKRYGGVKTLFNIHSWAPFYYDPMELTNGVFSIKPGLTLISQNLTGSSVLTAGYGYEKSNLAHINYQYLGLFPVFSFSFDLSNVYPTLFYINKTTPPIITEKRKESTLSIYLPLKLSSGRFSTLLRPFIQTISSNDYLFSASDSLYHKGLQRMNYKVYFSILQQQAFKDVRPRLGFVANIQMENAPFNKNNLGSLVAGTFNLYLPGLVANHSLFVKASFQNQNLKHYYYSNKIVFPKGYANYQSETYRGVSAEYLLPIAYPDFAFGSIVYLKRISLNAFYDIAKNQYPLKTQVQTDTMKSFGLEVYIDFKFLRTRYPIRLLLQQGWGGNTLLPFNSFGLFVDFYGQ